MTRAHGNVGVVRTKFRKNLPPKSLVRRVVLLCVPEESADVVSTVDLTCFSALPLRDGMCFWAGARWAPRVTKCLTTGC